MSHEQTDDAKLVERCQKGDREAINELVRKYKDTTYQFAYRLTLDPDDAADLTAETFCRVYTAMPRFRRESRFSTWLYRIVTNCFLDMKKREKHRRHASLDELTQTTEGTVQKEFEAQEGSPVESSERVEREQIMSTAIGELPDHQRAMIVMYHVEMLSYEEIASALDMPVGTVKSRLNRARLALREILEPYEELFTS